MPSFTCLPKYHRATKGETGNYQEDDYILDANGDRTPILKDGTDGQISYDDIDFDTDNLSTQVSVWLLIWERPTN